MSKISLNFYRPTICEISTRAFIHNLKTIKKNLSRSTRMLTVVKADAYGHGAIPLSRAAVSAGSDYLGVSSIEEGIHLREKGIRSRILVLGSHYPFSSFYAAERYNLITTVASLESARALSAVGKKRKKNMKYHFKVDTGMGRIGATPARSCEILKNIVKYPYVQLDGIYTHLASAETNSVYTRRQVAAFGELRRLLKESGVKVPLYHAANSAGVAQFPSSHFDMVRIGLAAYGLKPLKYGKYFKDLKPVLSWKTKIIFLKWLAKKSSVSYGCTYITKRNTHVATLPVGYADGFSRLLSNNADVLIRGKRCPVIGRVTMDMIMVDVTDVKNAAIGDQVVLIGSQGREKITVEEIASRSGTISYEVTCGISTRVPRIYT